MRRREKQPKRRAATAACQAMPRYRCTGRGAAKQEPCAFTTDDVEEANRHFERFDHDVEEETSR